MIRLRPYQEEAVRAILKAWKNGYGIHRQCVSLPTGTGKTLIFGALAQRLNTRTLILAHRGELIRQAVDKVKLVWPEAQVGIVQGQLDEGHAPVVVASIQTLARRKRVEQLLRHGAFNLIILDEAHHYGAPTYMETLEQLGAFRRRGPLLVGVTATPIREDDTLNYLFEALVYEKTILEMIQLGYLCDLRGIRIKTRLDFSNVKTVRTASGVPDWDEAALASVVNKPWFNELVVKVYLQEARGRQTVVFTCSVEHAEELTKRFKAAGVRADVVHGKLGERERRERLEAFSKRQLNVLVNCNLLVEGYDQPEVSCVMLARPTQSRVLYTQMVGRGTRVYPGKADCLVVDFVGSTDIGFNLSALMGFRPGEIKHGKSVLDVVEERQRRERRERWKHGQRRVPRVEGDQPAPDYAVQRTDLFSRTQFRWLQTEDGSLVLVGGDAGNIYLVPASDGFWRVFLVKDRVVRRLDSGDPLDITWAQGTAEDWIREHKKVSLADRQAAWRSRPATEAQLRKLDELGVPYSRLITAGEASDLLTVKFAVRDLELIRASGK